MTLAFHLFRKDVRQFRVLVAVWFGLLLLDFAVNLGWVGQVAFDPTHGFDHATNTWTGLLPAVIWMVMVVLVSLVVLTDSPARREGFLATRPVPRRDLLFAKLLFVFAVIVFPWTVGELIHLVVRGMPGWVILQGTLERLMFTLPVAIGFAAYAALWPGYGRWMLVLTATAIGGYLTLGVAVLLSDYVFHTSVFFESAKFSQLIVGEYAATLALVGVAIWHSRAHRSARARWSALVLVAVLYRLVIFFWTWDFFALQPENPSQVRSLVAGTGYEISMRSLWLKKNQDAGQPDKPRFNVSFTPRIQSLPPGVVIEWCSMGADLAGGFATLHSGGSPNAPVFAGDRWNNPYTISDYLAWSSAFPEDVLFRKDNSFDAAGFGSVAFDGFNLPSDPRQRTAPLTMNARFEARVYQWRKIADLPLTPGATATDEFGSWKFVAARNDKISHTELYIERSQIDLATSGNSRCSSADDGAISRMVFIVYDPLRHIAWLSGPSYMGDVTRGDHTALARFYTAPSFSDNARTPLTPDQIARDRLIIFEKSWLGSAPQSWQSPSFTIDEKLHLSTGGMAGGHEPMPASEFNHRIAALKTPTPDAGRPEVGSFLLEFLRLVDARRNPLPMDDPRTRQLAAFVPTHLDLLLDGLPVMEDASKRTVINAIKLGAVEAQKQAIIDTLQNSPELAEVLWAHGWVDDARAQIYQLATSSRPLPPMALSAIAGLHDPKTYPRLLEEFEANPRLNADDLLSTLPGLHDKLESVAVRAWHTQSLVTHQFDSEMFGEGFKLALRYGQTSALQRAYLYLNNPELGIPGNEFNIAHALDGGIFVPGLNWKEQGDYRPFVAWLRKHHPEDFVFNPALRQFVLKPNPSLTASNP